MQYQEWNLTDQDLSNLGLSGVGSSTNAAASANMKGLKPTRKKKIIHYTNGDYFEGQINESNLREGFGVYTCADRKRQTAYEYHGFWKQNLREGKNAQCYFYNEELYIGDWQQDRKHGQGDHFYKYNDERYIGDWRHDMRHGKGVLVSNGAPAGSSQSTGGHHHYEGRFKQDKRHGRGILKVTYNFPRYSTKQIEVKIYEQEWKNGKLIDQQKIHTVVGLDEIANLLLNTEQFKPNGKPGYNMYSLALLHIYKRN